MAPPWDEAVARDFADGIKLPSQLIEFTRREIVLLRSC